MTLVVDASAVIDLLVRSDRGARVHAFLAERAEEDMATVAHPDAEVCSGLARLSRADELDAADVAVLLRRLGDLTSGPRARTSACGAFARTRELASGPSSCPGDAPLP